MEVVIDVPSNEEARQEIETHRATWDWELRGYVRQDPETGRLQVLRYYDEKGKWIEVADTFDIPGWGKLTIEGDLDALANPEFENILPVKNPRFTKSEQSLQQWQNGLSHWSQDDTIINLKQVDNFTKASTMDTFRMNYPVEQADLENGITLELLPGYDSKQAKNSKFADEAVYESWFARTEGGRLIISFYVNYVDTTELARKVLERYPNINSVDLNILPIAVINWINNEPNNLQISKAGRVVDYNTKEGKLLPGVAETMMAFFDFEPSTSMELISQLNNYIIEVDR